MHGAAHLGELDGLTALVDFADKLEKAVTDTVELGLMTKDLADITTVKNAVSLNTEEFIKAVRKKLEETL